ncbi:spoT ppGpp synthetase [Orientia tsutsugamushi str. Gilliam]|uniref:SpoT ppGpp synthetase n=2 Tax=Orientia tsutsugamushi str. Gilliam TaxID=1359184 RepID=A0A2U3RC93_ORITS|nr:bifunctional (p)ppGpp synthetase/guanosine-3',5'-bis(diphosphate) 3'-pyrophosphohydrolase [Orientia tsutsugamushi]SPR10845.1 spoT ppGpp synthetase [Orientia tsutsugamushi str. Gilliam]
MQKTIDFAVKHCMYYELYPLEIGQMIVAIYPNYNALITSMLYTTVNTSNIETVQFSLKNIEDGFGAEVVKRVSNVLKLPFNNCVDDKLNQYDLNKIKIILLEIGKEEKTEVVLVRLAYLLHYISIFNRVPLTEEQIQFIVLEIVESYLPLIAELEIDDIQATVHQFLLSNLPLNATEKTVTDYLNIIKNVTPLIYNVVNKINDNLQHAGIRAEVSARVKSFYSIQQKMENKNIKFNQLDDIIALRIIVDSTNGALALCYKALSLIHNSYMFLPNKVQDFIKTPKENGYQSLHTIILGPANQKIEVQIRTSEMHRIAQSGTAAHWRYKSNFIKERRIHKVMQKLYEFSNASHNLSLTVRILSTDKFISMTLLYSIDSIGVFFAKELHLDVRSANYNGVNIRFDLLIQFVQCNAENQQFAIFRNQDIYFREHSKPNNNIISDCSVARVNMKTFEVHINNTIYSFANMVLVSMNNDYNLKIVRHPKKQNYTGIENVILANKHSTTFRQNTIIKHGINVATIRNENEMVLLRIIDQSRVQPITLSHIPLARMNKVSNTLNQSNEEVLLNSISQVVNVATIRNENEMVLLRIIDQSRVHPITLSHIPLTRMNKVSNTLNQSNEEVLLNSISQVVKVQTIAMQCTTFITSVTTAVLLETINSDESHKIEAVSSAALLDTEVPNEYSSEDEDGAYRRLLVDDLQDEDDEDDEDWEYYEDEDDYEDYEDEDDYEDYEDELENSKKREHTEFLLEFTVLINRIKEMNLQNCDDIDIQMERDIHAGTSSNALAAKHPKHKHSNVSNREEYKNTYTSILDIFSNKLKVENIFEGIVEKKICKILIEFMPLPIQEDCFSIVCEEAIMPKHLQLMVQMLACNAVDRNFFEKFTTYQTTNGHTIYSMAFQFIDRNMNRKCDSNNVVTFTTYLLYAYTLKASNELFEKFMTYKPEDENSINTMVLTIIENNPMHTTGLAAQLLCSCAIRGSSDCFVRAMDYEFKYNNNSYTLVTIVLSYVKTENKFWPITFICEQLKNASKQELCYMLITHTTEYTGTLLSVTLKCITDSVKDGKDSSEMIKCILAMISIAESNVIDLIDKLINEKLDHGNTVFSIVLKYIKEQKNYQPVDIIWEALKHDSQKMIPLAQRYDLIELMFDILREIKGHDIADEVYNKLINQKMLNDRTIVSEASQAVKESSSIIDSYLRKIQEKIEDCEKDKKYIIHESNADDLTQLRLLCSTACKVFFTKSEVLAKLIFHALMSNDFDEIVHRKIGENVELFENILRLTNTFKVAGAIKVEKTTELAENLRKKMIDVLINCKNISEETFSKLLCFKDESNKPFILTRTDNSEIVGILKNRNMDDQKTFVNIFGTQKLGDYIRWLSCGDKKVYDMLLLDIGNVNDNIEIKFDDQFTAARNLATYIIKQALYDNTPSKSNKCNTESRDDIYLYPHTSGMISERELSAMKYIDDTPCESSLENSDDGDDEVSFTGCS